MGCEKIAEFQKERLKDKVKTGREDEWKEHLPATLVKSKESEHFFLYVPDELCFRDKEIIEAKPIQHKRQVKMVSEEILIQNS